MGWYRQLINMLRPDRLSGDIRREMEFHMAERADELIARGMTEADARREARRRFGNPSVQRERTRDTDILTWLESLSADVRYALRALRASPGFAIVAILSLGLGIGANTAIFSLINAVVLRTLPVERPEELMQVTMGGKERGTVFTNPLWEAIRDRQDAFSGVFGYSGTEFNLTAGGEIRRANGTWVSGDYFSTLGVRPALGRLLVRADDVRGCQPVAVLGYGFWQSEYGGSRAVIGKTISLDHRPHMIVGVADPSFFGVNVGESAQVYVPLCLRPELDSRTMWYLRVVGRRKPGVTPQQVATRVAAIAPAVYEATVPERWGVAERAQYLTNGLSVVAAANGLSPIRRQYQRALMVLMAVVGLVLFVACANVANLLLARAAARGREMAIRLAIGAARRRLVRQLLTESVLLAALGAMAGIVFARWGTSLLIGLLSRGQLPVSLDVGLDGRVLAFTLGVAILTGLLFGLAPAWRATRIDPQAALKANGRGVAEGHSRFTIGKALVVGQIALSLVLVIGAGLLLGTFRNLVTLDPGFRRDGVLIVSVNLRNAGYGSDRYGAVHSDLLARFRALPGVQAAAASVITPISGSSWNDFIRVDGFTPKSTDDALAYFNQVTDGFFAAMGTPLLAGRDFDARDRLGAVPVVIVNEALAKKFFHGTSPLGKYYRLVEHDNLGVPIQIVGVVKDAKYEELREEALPAAYLPLSQDSARSPYANYVLRTAGAPSSLGPSVKALVAEVNRAIALELTPLSQQVDASLARERLLATLSGFFGALALLLATIGLYGTLSYSVARRRNEIGVRIALGAGRERVMRLVLGEVARLVIIGVALGTLAAFFSTRVMTSFLFGLSPSDPATVIGSAAILAAVGLAAGALPAWRAARVDPIAALREE
jgi:putative ABC transport system permease protein